MVRYLLFADRKKNGIKRAGIQNGIHFCNKNHLSPRSNDPLALPRSNDPLALIGISFSYFHSLCQILQINSSLFFFCVSDIIKNVLKENPKWFAKVFEEATLKINQVFFD